MTSVLIIAGYWDLPESYTVFGLELGSALGHIAFAASLAANEKEGAANSTHINARKSSLARLFIAQ